MTCFNVGAFEHKRNDGMILGNEDLSQQLFDNMAEVLAVYHAVDDAQDFVFVDFNRFGEELTCPLEEAVAGRRINEIFHSVEQLGLLEVFRRVNRTGKPEHLPLIVYKENSITRCVEVFVFKLLNGFIIAHYSASNTQRRTESTPQNNEEYLHIVSENTLEWEYWRAPNKEYLWASSACESISGYQLSECTGDAEDIIRNMIHPDDQHIWMKHVKEVDSQHSDHCDFEFRIIRLTGETVWISHTCKPIYGIGGVFLGHRGCNRDITALKLAEEAMRIREQEVRTLVEHSPDSIIRYNRRCVREYANVASNRIMIQQSEHLADEAAGSGPVDRAAFTEALQKTIETGQEAELEFLYQTPDCEMVWGLTRFAPEFDHENRVASVLAITKDISELVRHREELHRLAFYDPLTGLPNRALLMDRMRQEAGELKHRGGFFALMILDIDNFKDINDTLGYAAGDLLLRKIARRLSGCVREYDTLARLGGDEFALLLPGIRAGQDMGTVARTILDEVAKPMHVDEQDVFTSISIGIAIYPDDAHNLEELFGFADMAMYHSKAEGRNTFQFYNARLTKAAELRLSLGVAMRQGLPRGEFEVFYQPKVSMPEGRVLGAEALLRWNHPEMGLLTPDKFIGVAEDTGLIIEIGNWVLEQACAAVACWNHFRAEPLHVAVNLSGRQFVRNDLVNSVRQALDANGSLGSWLELEITESLMLEDKPYIQDMLEALSGLGVSIAIDDFGTGHSALSYINRFRVDVLKIDRSFVTGIESDKRKAALVKAFIAVGQALGMGLVAEGVELPEQAEFLYTNGCTVGQGYLYGRPVPLEVFNSLLYPTPVA